MVDATVLIGVDPHKASNTLAVMDPVTAVVIASRRFANTAAGYRELRDFSGRWSERRWAVEGCHGAGRSLAQRLVTDDELVLDVPAKLAARVRVYSQGHGRKTDTDDAISVALAALHGDGIAAAHADDTLVSLRLLSDRRSELIALRTQAVCRLHRLLSELTPGAMARKLSAGKGQQLLDKLRPDSPIDLVRAQLAGQHLDDIRRLDDKIKTVRIQIGDLVETSGTGLTELYDLGPVIAGRILAEGRQRQPLPEPAPLRLLQRHRTHRRLLRRAGPTPALPRRQPASEPRAAHDGRDPDPATRQPRPRLLRTQTPGGQDPERSAALPQAAPV